MLSLFDLAEAIPEDKKRKTEKDEEKEGEGITPVQQPANPPSTNIAPPQTQATTVAPLIGATGKDFVKSRLIEVGPVVTIREIQKNHGVDAKYDKFFVCVVCCVTLFFTK